MLPFVEREREWRRRLREMAKATIVVVSATSSTAAQATFSGELRRWFSAKTRRKPERSKKPNRFDRTEEIYPKKDKDDLGTRIQNLLNSHPFLSFLLQMMHTDILWTSQPLKFLQQYMSLYKTVERCYFTVLGRSPHNSLQSNCHCFDCFDQRKRDGEGNRRRWQRRLSPQLRQPAAPRLRRPSPASSGDGFR